MARNPFTPATVGKLKLLLFGPPASGKTTAALTFPRCAVIDTEGGVDKYAAVAKFDLLRVNSYKATLDAIKAVQDDNGQTWDTLVLDCITPVWGKVKRFYTGEGASVGGWAKANAAMSELYAALIDLPVHVVVTAHQYTELEVAGSRVTKLGDQPEADKSIKYAFDYAIRMLSDHSGVIERSRGPQLFPNGRLKDVSWAAFAPLFVPMASPAPQPAPVHADAPLDEGAATDEERDARLRLEFQDKKRVGKWLMAWKAEDERLTEKQLAAILKVSAWSAWPYGEEAADERVAEWLEEQGEPEDATPTSQPPLLP